MYACYCYNAMPEHAYDNNDTRLSCIIQNGLKDCGTKSHPSSKIFDKLLFGDRNRAKIIEI